ncbi:MAG: GTP-binding protein [Rhodospirillales bacterium]|nr:GTP-binding protein [Rhodospirillales bacterium]
MRVRTFTAATMSKAMAQVREELGDEAVIIATEPGRLGHDVQIIAALGEDDPDAAVFDAWSREELAPTPTAPITSALAYHGVPSPIADRLANRAAAFAHESPELALAAALDASLAFRSLGERPAPRPLMLVGLPGAGKTLTAAKLLVGAHRREHGMRAVTCDVHRAGGIEQLEAFTRILNVPLDTAETPSALADLALQPKDGAIVDTVGVNPFAGAEMNNLAALIEAVGAEPVLVLAAGGDAIEAGEIAAAFARIGCRRLIATRIDIARRLGALITAGETASLAFAGASISPHAADPIAGLNPLSLARLILSTTPDARTALHPEEAH